MAANETERSRTTTTTVTQQDHNYNPLRQGHSTSTVLTNRSKYITIIKDGDFIQKSARLKILQHPSSSILLSVSSSSSSSPSSLPAERFLFRRRKKGERPMHLSSLTFEKNPCDLSYKSTTREAYSGSRTLPRGEKPLICPSQHNSSHFSLGSFKACYKSFKPMNTLPTEYEISRTGKQRWHEEMSGINFLNSIRHQTKNSSDSTKPQEIISGHKGSWSNIPRIPPSNKLPMKVNIITGETYVGLERHDHRMITGNRILQTNRENTTELLLG